MKSFTSTVAIVAVAILMMSSLALARPHRRGGRGPPGQKLCYLESDGQVLKDDNECRGDDTCGAPFTILYDNTDAQAAFCEGQQSVCDDQQDTTESRPLPHGACLVERFDGSPEDTYSCPEGDECTRCPKILCIDGVEAVVTFCGRPEHDDSRREDGRTKPAEGDRPEVEFGSDRRQGGAEEDDEDTDLGFGRPERQVDLDVVQGGAMGEVDIDLDSGRPERRSGFDVMQGGDEEDNGSDGNTDLGFDRPDRQFGSDGRQGGTEEDNTENDRTRPEGDRPQVESGSDRQQGGTEGDNGAGGRPERQNGSDRPPRGGRGGGRGGRRGGRH